MRRLIILGASILLLLTLVALEVQITGAAEYPEKPISYVLPIGPGGGLDINTRPLTEKASGILGKPIVHTYKPGGAHTIAYREVYNAKPDGYTIGPFVETIVTSKLQGLFPIDYHDFTFIGAVYTSSPVVIASTKTKRPFNTIQEVFTFAKANPKEVSIATTTIGGSWWIACMLFQENSGAQFKIIPQEAGATQAVALIGGGHVDLAVVDLATSIPQIQSGNARFLGVLGPRRAPEPYNYAPTLNELGYDIIFRSISGIMAPPKMPEGITNKLVKTFETVFHDQAWQKLAISRNINPTYFTPNEAVRYLDTERKSWAAVMEKAGILKDK